jgi:hypothetical protein
MKLEDGEFDIYLVGFSLDICNELAKFGPTLVKCWLNWLSISHLFVNV